MQEILNSAGPQAARVESLWWLFVLMCGVVFVAILVAVAWALIRTRRGDAVTPPDISFHA